MCEGAPSGIPHSKDAGVNRSEMAEKGPRLTERLATLCSGCFSPRNVLVIPQKTIIADREHSSVFSHLLDSQGDESAELNHLAPMSAQKVRYGGYL